MNALNQFLTDAHAQANEAGLMGDVVVEWGERTLRGTMDSSESTRNLKPEMGGFVPEGDRCSVLVNVSEFNGDSARPKSRDRVRVVLDNGKGRARKWGIESVLDGSSNLTLRLVDPTATGVN